MFLAAIGQ